VLLSFNVVTFVLRIVRPDFFAEAMLEIILPVSFVPCAVLVDVDTVAVCFVVEPLTFEDVSIDVPELAMTACFVEPPVAFVFGAILPDLHSVAVLHVAEPLASVGGSILEVDLATVLKLALVDLIHVHSSGEVLVLVFQYIAASIRHVISVLGIHLTQLGSDSLTGHYSSAPRLEPHNHVDVPCKVVLYKDRLIRINKKMWDAYQLVLRQLDVAVLRQLDQKNDYRSQGCLPYCPR